MKSFGFTGSRAGITKAQENALRELFDYFYNNGFEAIRHGDCKGADASAHALAQEAGFFTYIHPCDMSWARAFCKPTPGWGEVLSVRPPLVRNRDIVRESEILVATPKEFSMIARSGTWATIRYAKKQDMDVYIIYPDGDTRNG